MSGLFSLFFSCRVLVNGSNLMDSCFDFDFDGNEPAKVQGVCLSLSNLPRSLLFSPYPSQK